MAQSEEIENRMKTQFETHEKLASKGDTKSQLFVSYLYQYALGVQKDEEKAKHYCRISSDGGNIVARGRQYFL